MDLRYVEDSGYAKRNIDVYVGAARGPVYDAVLDYTFSDESEVEPVTLQEAKDWLYVDEGQDSVLNMLIPAARLTVENRLNRSLIARTITATVKPGTKLPFGPVHETLSLTTFEGEAIAEDYKYTNGYDKVVVSYNVEPVVTQKDKLLVLKEIAKQHENRGDEK